MKRREFIGLVAALSASWSVTGLAQTKPFQVGWLVFGDSSLGPTDRSLKDALPQLGLAEGHNLQIIYKFANGNSARLLELAEELVAQKPDLLLGIGGDVIKALFEASKGAIPVVGGVSDSPVRAGFAASLAKPGKNFTGVTWLTDEMAGKRMELLKEVAPQTKRAAVIYNPQHLDDEISFARRSARALGIDITTHPIDSAGQLDAALRAATASDANSLFVIASRLTGFVGAKIGQYGLEQKLPIMTTWREFVTDGALLSYGPNRTFEAKRVAGYAQKVLNGSKPADLPIEQPVKFELVVNLKTARAIGLPISRDFLLRADDLIE